MFLFRVQTLFIRIQILRSKSFCWRWYFSKMRGHVILRSLPRKTVHILWLIIIKSEISLGQKQMIVNFPFPYTPEFIHILMSWWPRGVAAVNLRMIREKENCKLLSLFVKIQNRRMNGIFDLLMSLMVVVSKTFRNYHQKEKS